MPTRRAWVLTGGWDGHQPERIAAIVAALLRPEQFDVEIHRSLDVLEDAAALRGVDLIVPNWTQGTIGRSALTLWLAAVREGGTGVAGVHGGMGDAFRAEPSYQEMVGGQWVAHPGGDGATYTVHMNGPEDALTQGLHDVTITTEQYYMHVDPAITVHAVTHFGSVVMPVAWTKSYGRGRIFYCSVGHRPELLELPDLSALLRRGLLWAARETGSPE